MAEICLSCGAELAVRARYCHMCGRSVEALPAARETMLPPKRLEPARPARRRRGLSYSALVIGLLGLGAGLLTNRARIAASLNPPTASAFVTPGPVATPTPALPNYELLTLVVPAGGSYRLTFPNWPAGTTLEGYVQVDTEDVGFRIQQPDGSDLVNLASVGGRYTFAYTTPEAGQYSMIFGNQIDPQTDRQLVLVYRAYKLASG